MLRVNGFYGHIARNNFRSLWMFFGFAVACQLIGIALMVGPLLFFDIGNEPVSNFPGYVETYAGWVFGFTVLIFLFRLYKHVSDVRQAADYHLVTKAEELRVWKIVEMQAIGVGLKMPKIGVMEVDARNAFACGMSERSAVIVLTRGLIKSFDDEQLEAVISHELSHIKNGDIRLMAVANVMLSTLFWLKNKNPVSIKNHKQIILIVIFPPLLILFLLSGLITSVAITLGSLSRLLISSSREFIADAEAVSMTKNPPALISALQTIEGRSFIDGLDEGVDAMMIDGSTEGAYASHPSIAERIAVLVKHAGATAYGAGIRKDTRTSVDFAQDGNRSFGRRLPQQELPRKVPKKLLIDRVNAGSKENAFGLSPKMRNALLLALAIPFVLKTVGMMSVQKELTSYENLKKDISKPIVNTESGSVASATGNSKSLFARQQAKLLSKLDPLEARCFATKTYRVGDRGLRIFTEPNRTDIVAYAKMKKLPSDVEPAKYAATRAKSISKVRKATDDQELDAALVGYVETRKNMLMVMHRFFGAEGLRWMIELYHNGSDKEVLARLDERIASIGLLDNGSNFLREIELLQDSSRDFVPCVARVDISDI